MSNTTNNTQEIDNVLSVTKGEWMPYNFGAISAIKIKGLLEMGFSDRVAELNDYPEKHDNAIAICNAVNNTYGKSINPESVPLMLEALKGIMSIKGIEKYVTDYGLNLAKEAINKATI